MSNVPNRTIFRVRSKSEGDKWWTKSALYLDRDYAMARAARWRALGYEVQVLESDADFREVQIEEGSDD